jgi:hypothetical protein
MTTMLVTADLGFKQYGDALCPCHGPDRASSTAFCRAMTADAPQVVERVLWGEVLAQGTCDRTY